MPDAKSEIIASVDVVLLTLQEEKLKVALVRRDHDPFKGKMALPGVYIKATDPNVEAAAQRALLNKVGLNSPYLEQLMVFSGPDRDPRGWSMSSAHFAVVPVELLERCENPDLELRSVDDPRALPFDHDAIVQTAVSRLRTKGQYSSLPIYLAGDTFTKPELQRIFELVMGESLNKVSFLRKLEELDVIEEVPGKKSSGGMGPRAQLYRMKPEARKELSVLPRGM